MRRRFVYALKPAYIDRTVTLVEHQRGKYVCPLRCSDTMADACPVMRKLD
ncbi:MAG: hypothetical protein R2844_00920 [Caldilineales bacterium]